MLKKKSSLKSRLILTPSNLLSYNGYHAIILKVGSIDIDSLSEEDKEGAMIVFQSFLRSLQSNTQILYKKSYVNLDEHIEETKYISTSLPNLVSNQSEEYVDFIEEYSEGKMDKNCYIIVRTPRIYNEKDSLGYLEAFCSSTQNVLKSINIEVEHVIEEELEELLSLPEFIRENLDYVAFGEELRRIYVVTDYPSNGYPNWLGPVLNLPFPCEVSQHYAPFSKNKVTSQLMSTMAKIQSSIKVIEESGSIVPRELNEKATSIDELLTGLANGKESIVGASFYITVVANSQEELESFSRQLEITMRQLGIYYRTCRKEIDKAFLSSLPICDNHRLEFYPFDTHSLSTLIPLTTQNYTDKNGILYGTNESENELIMIDRWSLPNSSMLILGNTGYGKSMFAKVETERQIINGCHAIILDHNYEWKPFCEKNGGVYIEEPYRNPDLERHLVVLSSKNKTESLQYVWDYITKHQRHQRTILVIEEFHNIMYENPQLILQVIKEIRKNGVAPTLITQNAKDLLRSDEGQMIMDNCSIKVLFRQGDNDINYTERLFDLSRPDRLFLKKCEAGTGYLFTDRYKVKFKNKYSDIDEKTFNTNPFLKKGR